MSGVVCANCGLEFEPPGGRGGRPTRCPECSTAHRTVLSTRRLQRHALTEVATWIEVLAPAATSAEWELVMLPALERAREEVRRTQRGRCRRCDHEGRLLLATNDDGGVIGLCVEDHAAWSNERRPA